MFIDIEFQGGIRKKNDNNITVVDSRRVSELYIGLVNIVLNIFLDSVIDCI